MAPKQTIDIVLPVYQGNLHEIKPNTMALYQFCSSHLTDYSWRIVFGINGPFSEEFFKTIQAVEAGHVIASQQGKGHGVMKAWSESNADILVYLDIDLSTGIQSLPLLIKGVSENEICIGSRYHPDSQVDRSFTRKLLSVLYHKIVLPGIFGQRSYTDAQCGFKAISREAFKRIGPLVKNRNWYFESELLYLADRAGLRIIEIPIVWKETGLSGVKLWQAIFEFLYCSVELRLRAKT